MIAEPPGKAKWVGSSVKRKEDPRLLTGDGHFVDDIQFANLKHAAILRSPHAHARIRGIDTSKAEKLAGVLAVITGKDVEKIAAPFSLVSRLSVLPPASACGRAKLPPKPASPVSSSPTRAITTRPIRTLRLTSVASPSASTSTTA